VKRLLGLAAALFLLLVAARSESLPWCKPEEIISTNTSGIRVEALHEDLAVLRLEADLSAPAVDKTIKMLNEATEFASSVFLILHTNGGFVDEGRRLARAIERSSVPITCFAEEHASSMGFYVFQSCQRRWAAKNTHFLVHEPFIPRFEQANRFTLKKLEQDLEKDSIEMAKHEAKHMNIDYVELMKRTKERDWTMSADEALSVNAVELVFESLTEALHFAQTMQR
jgi:ATP-dependent protease ClpP protease subunit